MIHRKQRPNECALTALAMVTGDDEDTICRNTAVDRSHYSMAADTADWHEWQQDIEKIARVYPLIAPMVALRGMNIQGSPEVPLQGKGLIVIRYVWHRHAVAYENGIVFDPSLDAPLALAEYQRYIHEHGGSFEQVLHNE